MSEPESSPPQRSSQVPGAAWGVGTIALIAAFIWLLIQVQAVLSAVLGSVLLASLLEPAVAALARASVGKWVVGRRLASGVVVVVFLAVIGTVVYLLAPVLVSQASVLLHNVPGYLDKASQQYQALTRGMGFLPDEMSGAIQREFGNVMAQLGHQAAQAVLSLAGNIIGLLGLLVIPVGAFYFLSDGATIRADFLTALPPRWRDGTEALLDDTSRALASYVRGQTLVCASSSVLYSIVFGILGLPYFVVIGVAAGIGEAIPYLGSVIVGVAVMVIGLGEGLPFALRGLAGYLVANQIVNYLITPRFQAKSLALHPFLVILAALTGTSLGGALGAFLALPAAAILQSVLNRMWGATAAQKRRASDRPKSA